MGAYRIRVHASDGSAFERVIDRRVTIGREGGGLLILDQSVSRLHATLEPTGQGLLVTDLLSTSGTRLNGFRITQPSLCGVGDELVLGNSRIVIIGGPVHSGSITRSVAPSAVDDRGIGRAAHGVSRRGRDKSGIGISAGPSDVARLLLGLLSVVMASGIVATLGLAAVLAEDSVDADSVGSAATLGSMAGSIAAAVCVYWDAWTFRSHDVRVGRSSARTWAVAMVLFPPIAVPTYFARRVRMSPAAAAQGVQNGRRPDGSGAPGVVGVLIGLSLLAVMVVTPIAAVLRVPMESGPSELDTWETERQIESWISVNMNVYGVDVECSPRTWEVGGSFVCVARNEGTGQEVFIQGTMEDDAGNFTWEFV